MITTTPIPLSNTPFVTQILITFGFAHLVHIISGQLFLTCIYLSNFFVTFYAGRRDCIPFPAILFKLIKGDLHNLPTLCFYTIANKPYFLFNYFFDEHPSIRTVHFSCLSYCEMNGLTGDLISPLCV